MNVKPPADTDAPISVGIGGRTYEPDNKGIWRVDNPMDAEDLIRAGWTEADDAVPENPVSAPALPEGA